jgi:hypothetical protein
MSNINKIGLAILLLILVSGAWALIDSGILTNDRPVATDQAGLDPGVLLGGDTDSNTKAKIDQLSQLRDYYEQSMDERVRATLRTMILLEAKDVDNSKLPADLKNFIAEMRKEQQEAEQKEREQKEQERKEQ